VLYRLTTASIVPVLFLDCGSRADDRQPSELCISSDLGTQPLRRISRTTPAPSADTTIFGTDILFTWKVLPEPGRSALRQALSAQLRGHYLYPPTS
jgi:hypothetical protein